ncbi:hypothetical protein Mal35_29180 [Gimesia maris]|uniref:hypothetical protein n=1 Tax=Gimesia maris TaxID=122 RepID=UPI0011893CE9|nr:hypothetical protein [Gimesia maris]QDT79460.1 hypothetical protein Mal35_29180 [Gimesia maris]
MRRIIFCYLVFSLLAIAFVSITPVSGQKHPPKNSATFTPWPWPVALPTNSSAEIKAAADLLAKSLNSPLGVHQSNQNPGCALWLEVGSWKPNPSTPGYIILIQSGGGLIMATDLKQLQRAIDQLKQKTRARNGRTELPVGVITSYPIHPTH